MCNTYIVRLKYTCVYVCFRGASDARYSRCRNRARVDVGLSVGISVTASVPSMLLIFLLKTLFIKVVSLVL